MYFPLRIEKIHGYDGFPIEGAENRGQGYIRRTKIPVVPETVDFMDTRVFCVYNLARGVLLSSKVTVADGANQPLTILKVLVGGLAMDSKSGLWLSPVYGMPAVPRLFPFDLLYLDDELRVLDLAEFVPGAEFPPYRREVASALVVPSKSLHSSQTERGDRLLICPAEEMEGQIAIFSAGASASKGTTPLTNGHGGQIADPRVDPGPMVALGSRFAAPAGNGAAVAVAEEVVEATSQSKVDVPLQGSLRQITPLVIEATSAADCIATPASKQQKTDQPTLESFVGQELVEAPKGAHAVIGSEPIAVTTQEKASNESTASEVKSRFQSKSPIMSITEVILERPRTIEPPVIVGLHGDVEDLFSNWMDTPTLASTWKARSGEPLQAKIKPTLDSPAEETPGTEPVTTALTEPVSDSASLVSPVASVELSRAEEIKPAAIGSSMNQLEIRPQTTQIDSGVATPNDSARLKAEAGSPKSGHSQAGPVAPSPVATPIRVALPQPMQATTSTVAQYGLWRASLPTAVVPVAAGKEPTQERSEGTAGGASSKEVAKGSEGTKVEVSTAADPSASAVDRAGSTSSMQTTQAGVQRRGAGVFADGQTAAPERDGAVTKQSADKAMEAPPKRLIPPDNMLGADQRPKRAYKVASSAVPQKSAETDPVQAFNSQPDGPSAVTGVLPTEVVDLVQQKLGIGHAKAPETATPITVEKVEAARVQKIAVADSVDMAKNVPATELVTRSEAASQGDVSRTFVEPRQAAQNGKPTTPARQVEVNRKTPTAPPSLAVRFKRWLNPSNPAKNSDRRRAHRRYVPGMVAHYYTGGAPTPHEVADISMTGFYLLTDDRWMPDTMIQMTLQKPCAKGEPEAVHHGLSKIVRRGSDGVAAQFVMPETLIRMAMTFSRRRLPTDFLLPDLSNRGSY